MARQAEIAEKWSFSFAGRPRQMKIISPAVSGTGFARRAELFFLIVVSSPRRRLSEPEADQEKETSLCGLGVSNDPEYHRRGVGGWEIEATRMAHF